MRLATIISGALLLIGGGAGLVGCDDGDGTQTVQSAITGSVDANGQSNAYSSLASSSSISADTAILLRVDGNSSEKVAEADVNADGTFRFDGIEAQGSSVYQIDVKSGDDVTGRVVFDATLTASEDFQAPTVSQEATLESDVWLALGGQSSTVGRTDVQAWVSADLAFAGADAAVLAAALETGVETYTKAKADLDASNRTDVETTARAAAWFSIVSELKARSSAQATVDAAVVTGFGQATEAAAANSEGLDAEVKSFWAELKTATTVDAAIQARSDLSAKMAQEAGAGTSFTTALKAALTTDLNAALEGGVDGSLVATAFVSMHDSIATEASTLGLDSKATAALVLASEADVATTLDLTVDVVVSLTGVLDGIAEGAATVELVALGNVNASKSILASVTAASDGSFLIESPQEQPADSTVVLIAKDVEGDVMAATDVDYQSTTSGTLSTTFDLQTTAMAMVWVHGADQGSAVSDVDSEIFAEVVTDATAQAALDDGAFDAMTDGYLNAQAVLEGSADLDANLQAAAAWMAGVDGKADADTKFHSASMIRAQVLAMTAMHGWLDTNGSTSLAASVETAMNAYVAATATATTAQEVDAEAQAMAMAVIGDGTADNGTDGALEAWLVADLSSTLGATLLTSYDAAATSAAAAEASYTAALTGAASSDNQVGAVTTAFAAFETGADISTALSGVVSLDGGDANTITNVLVSVHATTAVSGAFNGQ